MYKLTMLAAALLAAQTAGAAEVYKAEDSSVNLYGKVYAGHIQGDSDKSENYGANQFVRFGAKAKSDVSDGVKAFMRYEVQMYVGDSEKIESKESKLTSGDEISQSTGNLRVRLGYAGIEADWGKVSFGRNYSAVELVSDWTDQSISDPFSQKALKATGRTSSLLKYEAEFAGLQFDASAKLRNSKDADKNQSSYAAALAYNFDFGLSLGTAFEVEVTDVFNEDKGDQHPSKPVLALVGFKYERDGLYTAFNYAHGENVVADNYDHQGFEFALGYSFDNGVSLMSLYNKGIKEKARSDEDSVDFADSITAGIAYDLNSNFSVLAEYRFILLGDNETNGVNHDELALAAVYSF